MSEPAKGPGPSTLLIACGALARELLQVIELNGWGHMTVTCLPASLHNRPNEITDAVRRKIRANRKRYDRILCLYGDCGTGGLLDRMLDEEGIERIDGPHCYAFYAGLEDFEAITDDDPATFFLTDYLVRHFERLIIKGLGLDRYPQLLDDYFGNYRRVVYLIQTPDETLRRKAEAAAKRLGLPLEVREIGLGGLERFLGDAESGEPNRGQPDDHLLA